MDQINSINTVYEQMGLDKLTDIKTVLEHPKVMLGNWPTDLMETNIDNFFIKRDDLSGFGRGGIKTRKLEGVLSNIENQGKTNLLMLVPNISNLRKDLELYVKSLNSDLNIHLLISNVPFFSKKTREKIPEINDANYKLVGSSWLTIISKLTIQYLKLGISKTMLVLPSIMHPSAVMGAATGMLELYAQCKQKDSLMPKDVFISACTGSSAAGLLLASEMLRKHNLADVQVHTIKTFKGKLKIWIYLMAWWTRKVYNLKVKVPYSRILIHKKHLDIPYGENTPYLISLCKKVKAEYNINIDPIYGARAWSVMNEHLQNDYKGEGLVYWHCGFTPDWNLKVELKCK